MANQSAGNTSIRHDPDIRLLLSRLPDATAASLSDQQLRHLKVAIGSGKWRKHTVDIRGAFAVPFKPSSIYFVVLMGRNLRQVSRREREVSFISLLTLIMVFFALSALLGLLSLYLLKSALGINLFAGFSLGLWHWLTEQ